MNPRKIVLTLAYVFLLLMSFSVVAAAEDYDLIVVNSNDWIDVYNSLLYGSLTNTKVLFLSDQSQTSLFFNSIDPQVESILLIESDSRLSPTARRVLDSLGYSVDVFSEEDSSLYFAELQDADSYVLVDKNFPANGLSVAPYAAASQSWVFFIDNTIGPEMEALINNKEVMTYGRIPLLLLQELTPSVVIDKGNKYKNSVEMAKLFLDKYPTTQFILTQGGFLESELFVPKFPVLLVGVSSAPKPIEDLFVNLDVRSAVVVGQASIPPSMNLKRFLESTYDKELKLVAKLGQTSADPNAVNEILPLNTYPIPSPEIKVILDSFFYNQITGQLEARFSNDGDVFVTYVPSIVLTLNGETIVLEAQEEFYALEKSESRTIQFPVDLNSFDEVQAQVTMVFGESDDSFDFSSSYDFSPVEFISIVDDSDVLVQDIVYDEKNKVFLITIFNNGSVPSYADIDLDNIIVGGNVESYSSPRAILIQPQESEQLVIYALLSEADTIANPQVQYNLVYGQREYALIKSREGVLPLGRVSSWVTLITSPGVMVASVAVLVFILLFFFLLRRRKSKKKEKY